MATKQAKSGKAQKPADLSKIADALECGESESDIIREIKGYTDMRDKLKEALGVSMAKEVIPAIKALQKKTRPVKNDEAAAAKKIFQNSETPAALAFRRVVHLHNLNHPWTEEGILETLSKVKAIDPNVHAHIIG